MFGWLPMGFITGRENDANHGAKGMYWMSGLPHVLVSASAGEAVTFTVPFISPNRAVALDTYLLDEIGVLKVYCVNPLKTTDGSSPQAMYTIRAEFVDPQVYLPGTKFTLESKNEADVKTSMGTISDIAQTANAVKSIVKNPKNVAPYIDFMEGAAGLASDLAGLEKPMTLDQTTIIKALPFGDHPYGRGVSLDPKLTMDPKCEIGVQPIGPKPIDEMELTTIVGTPMLKSIKLVHAADLNSPILLDKLTLDGETYGSFVGSFFKFWRGSLKYYFNITASLFHSVRLVFYIAHKGTQKPGDWMNCYHKMVDVQADTEVMWAFTQLNIHFNRQIGVDPPYYLYVIPIAFNQPDMGQNSPVYINIYCACDSDVRFSGYMDREVVVESNPHVIFAEPFEMFAPGMTGYHTENLTEGETYTHLKDIILRKHPDEYVGRVPVEAVQSMKNNMVSWEKFGWLFLFFRGSSRLTLFFKASNVFDTVAWWQGQTEDYYLGYDVSTMQNQYLSFEIPWYELSPFQYVKNHNVDYKRWFKHTSSTSLFLSRSAGDDFTYFGLVPPPPTQLFGNRQPLLG